MDLTNTPLTTPIHPYIECDGGYYAVCNRCYTEVEPTDDICPKCSQAQDWTWFRNAVNTTNK